MEEVGYNLNDKMPSSKIFKIIQDQLANLIGKIWSEMLLSTVTRDVLEGSDLTPSSLKKIYGELLIEVENLLGRQGAEFFNQLVSNSIHNEKLDFYQEVIDFRYQQQNNIKDRMKIFQ